MNWNSVYSASVEVGRCCGWSESSHRSEGLERLGYSGSSEGSDRSEGQRSARNPEAMIASTAVPLLGLAVGLAMHGYQQEQDKAAEKEAENEGEREYQATAVHHNSMSSIAAMATRSAENTTVPINTPVKLGRLDQELGTHAVLSPEERSMIASMRRQLV